MDKKAGHSKVKVVVRVRPTLNSDGEACVAVTGNKVSIQNLRNKAECLQYEFSSVYDESTTQSDIFNDCVQPLLNSTLKGQNVSIFAYGPTGAGKTHTMLGVMSDPGIIPRVVRSLFSCIQERETASRGPADEPAQHTVTFSYMEIYNEKVQDLLSGKQDLPIREDSKHNIFVAGITEKTIDSFETFKGHFEPASSNRTVAATKLNAYSSRSHSILLLKVQCRAHKSQYTGKIYLIDLAGSEDNRRTGNQGLRLKESGAINKSLFVLGEVVDAINQKLPRVPYRNSKLTRLLQDSIGGSCQSVMITNIAPEPNYYYDTYCTLNFATKSKRIVNVSTVNVKADSPPRQSKPVAAVKPCKRRSSLIPVGSSKKSRLSLPSGTDAALLSSSSSSLCGDASCVASYFPSPLLRRHKELESAYEKKLQDMDKVLQSLKKSAHEYLNPDQVVVRTDTPQHCHQPTPSSTGSPDIIFATPNIAAKTGKLVDSTNLWRNHVEMMQKKNNRLKLKKTIKDEPSCSPLFPNSPVVARKQKVMKRRNSDLTPGEKLTKRRNSDLTPVRQQLQESSARFANSSEQFQRNAAFLEMLNTASVKQLQELQTVGVKRAKAIYDWRQLHGHFNFIDELLQVPGFTDKYIQKLLQRNLVILPEGGQ
ncbi:hypothetical protein BsWGS_22131 [Bradybaena similaris]